MNNVAIKPPQYPPMLQQYLDYKARYSDSFLFFQVGDFYEIFFEDAALVSKALNLTLTSRDKNSPDPIPMCGVPVAVVEGYVDRLVSAGHSVAIVSQMQNGAANGRQPVERQLERIITPGIRILSNAGQDSSEHLLVSVSVASRNDAALAFGDVQSGTLSVREGIDEQTLFGEILRLAPSEIVIPNYDGQRKIDRRTGWVCDLERAVPGISIKFRALSESGFEKGQRPLSEVKGYSALGTAGKKAVRLLSDYIDETIVNLNLPLREIVPYREGDSVIIDSIARANLELLRNLRQGNEEHTLIGVIDRTVTPGGARLIRRWVGAPLISVEAINQRLDCVSALMQAAAERSDLRSQMKYIADLERIAARIELKVVGPRELAALRDGLGLLPQLRKLLLSERLSGAARLSQLSGDLAAPPEIAEKLHAALADSPEPSLQHGGVIRDGYDAEIDRLRAIKSKGRSWIAELEAQEKARTGIGSLKIKYNNVLGYFIEITSANIGKVPADYVRRQSTANTERYTTESLRQREEEVLGAEDKEIRLEKELFERLRQVLLPEVDKIRKVAAVLSEIDCFLSFAEVSEREDYRRPTVDDSFDIAIEEGRHPVISRILQNKYVPTSIEITGQNKSFMIITGPNMGGKSTYLRQTALITILAQIGCFVPARKARIGIVDRIFARLGASDNLSEGDSTFMVEMREAAHIIAHASERSLLLIDEIGRGTATGDGLAIAQAILEWIITKVKARALFATHFHELTELESSLPAISNLSVGSYEEGGQVIFTHHILPGPASRSYGIEVAKLAGLPKGLLRRAQELLLERLQRADDKSGRQISLFSRVETDNLPDREEEPAIDRRDSEYDALAAKLKALEVDRMTPLEALTFLSSLKEELKDD